MKCRAWGQESVRISVIARESVIAGVCLGHFFMRFAGGLPFVRISGESVIARCAQGEMSTLFVL